MAGCNACSSAARRRSIVVFGPVSGARPVSPLHSATLVAVPDRPPAGLLVLPGAAPVETDGTRHA
jgi:hypothetical protein